MKKALLAFGSSALFLSPFFVPSPALAAEVYTLDPFHTNLTWGANHFGFSNPSGKFSVVTGQVALDQSNPSASSVDVTVRTGSVTTGVPLFDEHLSSEKFFDSTKYPEAKFRSSKVEVTGANTAKVTGDLVLLGVSKPVTLDVTLNKIGESPISKLKTAGFSASGVIKRSEFGMNYALPGVSDEVKLTIEAEANIQPKTN